MATLKLRLNRFTSPTAFDTLHLETSSDVVMRPNGSTVEATLKNILKRLDNFNIDMTALDVVDGKLVATYSGDCPFELVPDGRDTVNLVVNYEGEEEPDLVIENGELVSYYPDDD